MRLLRAVTAVHKEQKYLEMEMQLKVTFSKNPARLNISRYQDVKSMQFKHDNDRQGSWEGRMDVGMVEDQCCVERSECDGMSHPVTSSLANGKFGCR